MEAFKQVQFNANEVYNRTLGSIILQLQE